MEQDSLLKPYRIVDLTDEKGLLCGKILGDLGADVIKVEPPGGDDARNIGPFYGHMPHPERSLFWWAFNTSKRGITLDIRAEKGRDLFRQLVETSDFVIESFPPGYLDGLGLGYSTLKELNSDLIMVSITPFGSDGPYRDFKGSDLVLTAMGGALFTSGDADRPPVRTSVSQAYLQGSAHAAIGALAALCYRARTGRGQHVDVSIQAAMAQLNSSGAVPEWFYGRKLLSRNGPFGHSVGHVVRQIYRCKDGHVAFRILTGQRFGKLIAPLTVWMAEEGCSNGLDNMDWPTMDMSKLSDNDVQKMEAVFASFFLEHTKSELVHEAMKRHFMLLEVASPEQIVKDEHLSYRDYWVKVEHPELGRKFLYPGAPYKIDSLPWRITRRAPLIGEHTQEVLQEMANRLSARPLATRAVCAPGRTSESLAPLAGVKILDFTWGGAGPFATCELACFGAQVVRIESRTAIDTTRTSGPFKDGKPGENRATNVPMHHASKYSMSINLKTALGRQVVKKLVRWSDVVTENFGAGTMNKLGFSYDALKEINDDIIMVSSCMFGQTGPRASFVGMGWHLSGPAGFYYLTGWPDRDPVLPNAAITDHIAPWYFAIAVLAGVDYNRRTGRGLYVDQSQLEASISFLSTALLDYTVNGNVHGRRGNASDRAAPHGVYPCAGKDRWCAITIYTDEEWRSFCRVVGRPLWVRDQRFSTLEERKRNRMELDRMVANWTVKHGAEEVMSLLQAASVPAGVVQNEEDIVDKDPQLARWEVFPVREHPELGAAVHAGWPVHFSEGLVEVRPAPCLGEHTEYICREILGMSDSEFIAFVDSGASD